MHTVFILDIHHNTNKTTPILPFPSSMYMYLSPIIQLCCYYLCASEEVLVRKALQLETREENTQLTKLTKFILRQRRRVSLTHMEIKIASDGTRKA